MLLAEMPRSRGRSFVSGLAAPHPAVTKAARVLADDPSLSGADSAARLQVSAGRFARVFKSEMGVSLVRYRNQLRLERFMKIMDAGRSNMREAALAAGFGSYAQFHRVFQAQRGTTPRAYLARARQRPRAASAARCTRLHRRNSRTVGLRATAAREAVPGSALAEAEAAGRGLAGGVAGRTRRSVGHAAGARRHGHVARVRVEAQSRRS